MLLLDESPNSLSDEDQSLNCSSETQGRLSNHWESSSSSLSEHTPALMLASAPSCPQSCPPVLLDAHSSELDLGVTNTRRNSKPAHMRRNIRKLLKENQLDVTTKAAQLEEIERLRRLEQQRKDLGVAPQPEFQAVLGDLLSVTQGSKGFQTTNGSEPPVLSTTYLEKDQSSEENRVTHSINNSACGHEDSAAAHVSDDLNQPDAQRRVLINVNHPPDESDFYLLPQLSRTVKPHQIGGIRFLYDNLVESLDRFKNTPGFGCILAHSMGLGKTLQVISFIDILLRHIGAHTVLVIVPVNTLQNWWAEFNLWVPPPEALPSDNHPDYITPRAFKVHILNDEHKTTGSRAKVIEDWYREGGVLMMGYEMYRILSMKKGCAAGRKKKNPKVHEPLVDMDEEDHQQDLRKGIEMALAQPGPDVVVCDEGHRIKNWHASTSRALNAIGTRRRLVLTGYPLQNNLLEYWCMVDFVRPGFLGTRSEFSNMFERPILNGQCMDSTLEDVMLMRYRSHVLHSLLEGFVQRCGHDVLFSQLPEKQEHVILVRLSSLQRRLYTAFMNRFREPGNTCWSSLNPLKAFCVCCKIWNHPDVLFEALQRENMATEQDLDLDDVTASNSRCSAAAQKAKLNGSVAVEGGSSLSQLQEKASQVITYEWAKDTLVGYKAGILENSAKMVLLFHIIDESVKNQEKVLVFSQSLSTLSVIEEFLSKRLIPDHSRAGVQQNWVRNVNYYRLDGSTSVSERERLISQFNDDTNRSAWVFLLSTRAGCLGVNLVGASRVVVFDASWNPCHDAQAVCRVYRYGQRKPCHIYRLVCDFTLEKKIYDRQISKRGMSDRVIDDLNPTLTFTRREVESLLHFVEEEPNPVDVTSLVQEDTDSVLKTACMRYPHLITKQPFHHESLLMDRQDLKLTNEEKEAARRSYEDEKRASVPYTRPSYAHYYPASDQSLSNIPAFSQRNWRPPPQPENKPTATVPLPVHQREGSTFSSLTSGSKSSNNFPVTYLQKAGVSVQKIVTTTDILIPATNSSSDVQAKISAGESIHIIRGTKGTYIRTSDGRIFAIRAVRKNKQHDEITNTKKELDICQNTNDGMSPEYVPKLMTSTRPLSPDEPRILSELQHFTKESIKTSNSKMTSEKGSISVLPQRNFSSSDPELPLDLRGNKRKSISLLSDESSPKQPAAESKTLAPQFEQNYSFKNNYSMKPNSTVSTTHQSSLNSVWSPYFQPQVPKAEPHHMFLVSSDAHSLGSKSMHSSSPSFLNIAATTTATTSSFTSVTASGLRHGISEMLPPRFLSQFGQTLGMYTSTVMPGGMPGQEESTFLPQYGSSSLQDGNPCLAANNNAVGCGVKGPIFNTDDEIIPVMDKLNH